MTRDNVLFATIGLLAGFIAGYVMHEVMAARQPPRRVSGQAVAAPASTGPGSGGAFAPEVQMLQQRLAENPRDTEALRRLGNLNYDIQNWSRAVELYERFLEVQPEEVDVMTDLGASYRSLGEPQRAMQLFREVRKIDPEHWQSRYNEILVLAFDLGDLATASERMAELKALQPGNSDVDRLAAELEKRRAGA